MTVATQFLTSDGNDDKDLAEIRRIYAQDGKEVANSDVAPIVENARQPQRYHVLIGMADVNLSDVTQPDHARLVLRSVCFRRATEDVNVIIATSLRMTWGCDFTAYAHDRDERDVPVTSRSRPVHVPPTFRPVSIDYS